MTTSLVENSVLFSMALATSRPQPVPSGVPQGSVLGPFLFTLHINDLADMQLSEGSKLVAYADDLLLYKPVESYADYNTMQEDVTTIDHWMSHNFLTLNATKCKHMVITRSRIHLCPQLYLAGQPLECVQSYKYLGVIANHFQSILVGTYTVHLQQE